jgi:CheY-like chemotaxis protein
MSALPLFYYPTTTLWLDDEPLFLETMLHVFGQQQKILPYQAPQQCLQFLETYQEPLQQYNFLQCDKDNENVDLLSSTPINFDITAIAGLLNNPARFDEISVLVVDYHMPNINGFEFCQQTTAFSFQKLLLTGNTEETKAIEGFNDGLIQRFVQKSADNMRAKLSQYIAELSLQYFQRMTSPLLTYLQSNLNLPQSNPEFIRFFTDYRTENNLQEFYLLDKQGSYLCINKSGQQSVLLIHTQNSLSAWLEMYTEDANLNTEQAAAVAAGKQLPFFGIGQDAWQIDNITWETHFHAGQRLSPGSDYFYSPITLS